MVARLTVVGRQGLRCAAGMWLCLALGKQVTFRAQCRALLAWEIGDITQHAAA